MDFTEEQLRNMALALVQLAFVAGLAGAIVVHLIVGTVTAVASWLAERAARARRIRLARERSGQPLKPAIQACEE